ncbi:MAG: histidinol-phosphate aminotransferase family protein [Clostridiales bacterium]|jgi:histidinol-phosphate aminotransferase|nr:histidinol-phosphate aminotransferase family protein [Clostridiales bacterium]
MAYRLNRKISDLEPYDPISGNYRIRLDANESFLPLPEEVRQNLAQDIASMPFNRYPDPCCTKLCKAFAGYYSIDPQLVTAGNGSDELISLIMTAFLMKGEKVITVKPDFSMYQFYASISEAPCVVVDKEEDLSISVDQLIAACRNENAKMIIFSNPCNPTSLGLAADEVRRLIRCVNALVVLDEAYMDFWDQSLLGEVEQYDNLIILRTSSKAVGGAAIRLGFAVANPVITRALRAVKSPYNVNSFTQQAGIQLFSHKEALQKACGELISAREKLYQGISELEQKFPSRLHVYPTCTNFVFLRMDQAKEAFDFFLEQGVAIRFMGQYLRITAGSPEENQEALRLLREFMNR